VKDLKVFVNGMIFTADARMKWADAVVTGNDKILFVGSYEKAKEFIDKNTEIIDLQNRLVLPGFIDAHAHIVMGGEYLLGVDLTQAKSPNDFKESLQNFIGENRDKWITGGNWNHENYENAVLPHKNWIDEFSKDTPIFVSRMDYHMGLANSKALELAGIDKNTQDPIGGTIEKDESGQPTGILKDKAMELVYNVIPEPEDLELERALDSAMNEAMRFGVTSIHDITYKNHLRAFQNYAEKKKLKTRIYTRLPIQNRNDLINSEIQYGFGNEWIKIGSMKAFADGSLGSSTALFFNPYTDDTSLYGLAMDVIQNGNLEKWALLCDKAKLQLSIHAIGDKAISQVLDIFEKIREQNPPWERRFRIEHAQHIAKKDFLRLAELDAIVSAQPYHLFDDGCWAEKKIGSERLRNSFAYNSLLNSGVKMCFGSDWPVVTLNPLTGIYAAVTRQTADGHNPKGLVPDEKISVEESVKAYTINGAYAAFEENIKGSISPGKLADMVVLSENIFEIEPEKIKDVRVVKTILDGEIIYDNGE